jgi:methionyl aminopeptidase
VKPSDLDMLRRSGQITATARETCKKMIKAGTRLEDIACEAERIIREMGGGLAFPAQLSRNNIAAHYCSPIDDPTVVEEGDIIKLDVGAHVDGWVTDSATTVDLRNGPDSALVAASRVALENAISLMGPGASITEIGHQIEQTVIAFGLKPIYNLTGHGVSRYTVHCKPSIYSYAEANAGRLRAGQTVACEPFVCDGAGYIENRGEPEVFGLKRKIKPRDRISKDVEAALESIHGLPFARRNLVEHLGTAERVEKALQNLAKARILLDYPPLAEKPGVRVAQTEHTIFIHDDGAEVLTRLDD